MWNHNYYVYITTNPDKTVLYIGVTNDIAIRLRQHKEIKKWRREKKNALIETKNPDWIFLNDQVGD